MPPARTSMTHPLQIAEVRATPEHGRIGITFCPGKQDRFAATGAWERDLPTDLKVIKDWGATLVLTLVESHELKSLKVPTLGEEVVQQGMTWLHMPIADYSTPTATFEQRWSSEGREVRELLRRGEDILVHCKGGMGRAGMMAARLLVELGNDPEDAIHQVRRVRSGAIETPSQLALVRNTKAILDDL
ncbi:cyclin-dependent kinase inhibitor 3 family protein [Oceanobacter mangrovi]|uniref:cyclin-dependent kinase inhibitor 3 family protein n=1 Tax=Oceanobacter mangrovi TaxID=2862510 RepID=UPI001C8ED2FF|nr:cyclin-dependent kinase inhibitor 3 family protein [Oceanobacter mangrovi]